MAKKKITTDDVNALLVALNHSIKHTGRYLCAQGRNGYIGIDIYKGDASEGNAGMCLDTLVTGTARECIKAAEAYAAKPH